MSKLDRTGVQGTVMATDGILLMGLSLVVTILGTQAYYRIRGQPINNAVAGLVIGMCTGAMVFSEMWFTLFGFVSHRAIQLDSQVFYSILIPPIVFYAGFSVKKKLFFKNLVTIAIFGILGCNLTAGLLSAGIYPILKGLDIQSLHTRAPLSQLPASLLPQPLPPLVTTPDSTAPRALLAAPDAPVITPIPLPPLVPSTPVPSSPDDPPRDAPDTPGRTLLSKALSLGTVFSPTDNLAILHYLSPNTQPVLHSLLFGEGVMNDISAVVMLMTMTDMDTITAGSLATHYAQFVGMFVVSSLLGVAAGLLSALLTKHFFDEAHHHTDREVILMTSVAVSAYICAASAGYSGTLAVFFCGITMSHYTWHSISASARVMSVHNFRVLCSVSEMFLFIYAGLDVSSKLSTHISYARGRGDTAFLRTVLALACALGLLILIVRALFVALAVAIVNLWRSYKFTIREAVTMWYGGLVRGSITTALAYSYLYTPPRSTAADEAILLSSILVIVVTTVAIGGASEAFMRFMTLPSAQTRLIEITSLPGMGEDDFSMHSAAVLSSKLHKMWRRFDRNVFQRLFGGRDTRMPNYFASVAELNQRILRIQDTSGHLPVSVMPHAQANSLPPREQHALLSSAPSTHMSDMLTVDFHDSECGSHYVPSGSPSPRPSSWEHSHHDVEHGWQRTPHHNSSDPRSQTAVSVGSSTPNHNTYDGGLPDTDLPSTTHLLQQMDAGCATGMSVPGGGGGGGAGPASEVSLFEGLLFPRSHSDPHVQDSPRGSNGHGPPPASRRLKHSKTMHENRVRPVRVHAGGSRDDLSPGPSMRIRGKNGSAHSAPPPAHLSLPENMLGNTPRLESTLPVSGSMRGHRSHRASASAAAAESPELDSDGSTMGSEGLLDAGLSPKLPDVARALTKQRSRAGSGWQTQGTDVDQSGLSQGRGEPEERSGDARDGAPEPRLSASADRRPPVGPSAAAARRAALTDPVAVPEGRTSTDAQEAWSEQVRTSTGGSPQSLSMTRQLSRVISDAFFVSAYSGAADNLPGPFQPPPSNATSEDVHVGAEGPFSSFEDALLDLTHGGEDLHIPWDEYDEADKRAAHGSRSAMN
eukprot:jgi/Ulvmu1/8751/UM048_0005.1